MLRSLALFCLLALLVCTAPATAQDRELGLPFVQNFTPSAYNAKGRNVAVAQDERGVMYFANQEGVLVFDGVQWNLVRLPNRVAVRSLASDEDGRIWVGADGTFGYLEADEGGRLAFVSLKDKLPAAQRTFNEVWRVHGLEGQACFQAYEGLYCWDGSTMDVQTPGTGAFDFSFLVGDDLYVQHRTRGLLRYADGTLTLAPGGEAFAGRFLFFMIPYDDNRALVGDERGGLFLYGNGQVQPFATAAAGFFQRNLLTAATALNDSTFAIATQRGGVAVIGRNGQLRRVLDTDTGLQDDEVVAVGTDRDGGLWLALDGGLARVEVPSPLNLYDERNRLQGRVTDLLRHPGSGRLYVTTLLRTYFLQPAENARFAFFEPVFNLHEQAAHDLAAAGGQLYVAANDGVYVIEGVDGARRLWAGPARRLHPARRGNHFFVAAGDSLVQLAPASGWRVMAVLPGLGGGITSLAEAEPGVLWVGLNEGVARIAYADSLGGTRLDDGLPDGPVRVEQVGDDMIFLTDDGVYHFDAARERFEARETWQPGAVRQPIQFIARDADQQLWVVPQDTLPYLGTLGADNDYTWEPTPINRAGDFDVNALLLDGNNVWVGGADGLVRYNRSIQLGVGPTFQAVIRRVTTADGDSLLYGGSRTERVVARLSAEFNDLQFEFAAPTFDSGNTRYQYYLEGADRGWSDLVDRTMKDYTNLAPGRYTFHVRARNAYGLLSEEDTFAFRIEPPWYLRWWMWVLYVVMALALVVAFVQWRSRRLLEQNRELEHAVRERTTALRASRDELAREKETLQRTLKELKSTQQQLVQSEKMAALGTLTAGVAHEIKNPLNFVNNFAELSVEMAGELRDEVEGQRDKLDDESYEEIGALLADLSMNASKIAEHGKRADSIVRNMLMHSRGKAGQREPTAFNAFVKEYVNLAFHGERARKPSFNIRIEEDFDEKVDQISFVPQDMSRVILNLLSNAFYATHERQKQGEEGYTPTVRIATQRTREGVVLRIRDNGTGMPKDVQEKVFEPFYTTKPTGEGTGLGLSLSFDIITQKHGGTMTVDAEEGSHTELVVTLPDDSTTAH